MGPASLSALDQGLAGVERLAFDTAPLIYLVERHPRYVDLMRNILRRVDAGALAGCSSVITLTEVLAKPKQSGQVSIQNAYRDILLHSGNFRLVPIDAFIAEHAATLRALHSLRTPDALQLAAALSAGCQAFLTNDKTLKRVTELRILLLDDLAEATEREGSAEEPTA
jgi:predicted nucleic acid-binding protein